MQSDLESEFYRFVENELTELRHPYSRQAASYRLGDPPSTARSFIAALRYEVPGKKPQDFRQDFLGAFADFRSGVARQANALKPLGTACETYINKIAHMLGKYSRAVGAWGLTGPNYLDIIGDRVVAGKEHLTRPEHELDEDVTYWSTRPTGEALIYRARRTRNAGNHGFDKITGRERKDRFYDLLGALLYVTDQKSVELDAVIYADEKSKEARAFKNLYNQAVASWKKARTLAGKDVLEKFYEHRDKFDIDADGLQFLLESEIGEIKGNIFATVFDKMMPKWEPALRWINSVSSDVCSKTLYNILSSFSEGKLDGELASHLTADLCGASSVEFQRELAMKFISSTQQPAPEFFSKAYRVSYIPTESKDVLLYLQGLILSNHPAALKEPVANRLLVHYTEKFPRFVSYKYLDNQRPSIQSWVDSFPRPLLGDGTFRNVAFGYVSGLSDSSIGERGRLGIFEVEMLKILYDRDPNQTVETLQHIAEMPNLESFKLLRAYAPQAVIARVVNMLGRQSFLHNKGEIALLEAMDSPETDALLVRDLDKFILKFKNGSRRCGFSWCGDVSPIVAAVRRRQIAAAMPKLAKIVERNEPQYFKLVCLTAIAEISRKSSLELDEQIIQTIEILEAIAQNAKEDKVRKSADRALKALKKSATPTGQAP